jgi:hypothetical protein
MTEASRVQKLLNEQNAEIDRLKNRIEKLEAALREIDEWAEEQCYVGLRKLIRSALEWKKDDPQADL